MIRDRNGLPTETNAPRRDTDCIEVVFAFSTLIRAFEEWLTQRDMYLFPIPVDGDDLPTYGIGVIGLRETHPPAEPCAYCAGYRGRPCECAALIAAVTTHTQTSTNQGPDYCAECSAVVSEWVPWPCPSVVTRPGSEAGQ